jgi:hypothetical protein
MPSDIEAAERALQDALLSTKHLTDDRLALLDVLMRAVRAEIAAAEWRGAARVVALAQSLSYPVGVMGGRAVDANALRARVAEGATPQGEATKAGER